MVTSLVLCGPNCQFSLCPINNSSSVSYHKHGPEIEGSDGFTTVKCCLTLWMYSLVILFLTYPCLMLPIYKIPDTCRLYLIVPDGLVDWYFNSVTIHSFIPFYCYCSTLLLYMSCDFFYLHCPRNKYLG